MSGGVMSGSAGQTAKDSEDLTSMRRQSGGLRSVVGGLKEPHPLVVLPHPQTVL